MENKKQSREEIYNDLGSLVEIFKAKKEEITFELHKKNVTNLEQLAALQREADEQDICIQNWDLLVEIGIDTWDKVDREYNRIQDGVANYKEKEHNAIMTIWSFVDLDYSEQSEQKFDYGNE